MQMQHVFILLAYITQILSYIVVRSPKELAAQFPNQTIHASLSNFGKIPYGHTLVGRVYHDPTSEDKELACKALTSIKIGTDHNVDESPIVMIDRGNCTFVTKVRNVEDIGGHVALIIDNIPDEKPKSVIMSDDGLGRDITIPGMLISYEDGKKLKEHYKKIQNNARALKEMILEIVFEMEHPSNSVSYDLWLTSDTEIVYKLLIDLYYYHQLLENKANLTVHYVTYQYFSYDPDSTSNIAVKNCLGKGKYCDNPGKFNTKDGRDIVKENIKQKCVYKYAYTDVNDTSLYWNYMKSFYVNCLNLTTPLFDSACSALAGKMANLPVEEINKCIARSYTAKEEERKTLNWEDYSDNTMLDKDNEDRATFRMTLIPSITINNRTFWGTWRAENVFEALCAGFKKKPEACYREGGFERQSKVSWLSVALIIVLIVVVNIVIFIICKKFIKRKIEENLEATDINHKINTVVTSYLALKEHK